MKSQIEFAFSSKSQFNRFWFGSSPRYTCIQRLEAVADWIAWEVNIHTWYEMWGSLTRRRMTKHGSRRRQHITCGESMNRWSEMFSLYCSTLKLRCARKHIFISSAAYRLVCPIVIGEEELNAENSNFQLTFLFILILSFTIWYSFPFEYLKKLLKFSLSLYLSCEWSFTPCPCPVSILVNQFSFVFHRSWAAEQPSD